MDKRLIDQLEEYHTKDILPLHMPGHKRQTEMFDYLQNLGIDRDLTEIHGFDDLHNPTGILRNGMTRLAKLYGSRHSYFLVNGSTCGILAGIRTVLKHGDTAVVARNCHRSVYNGLELCGVQSYFVMPEWDPSFGIYGAISPESIENTLIEHPNTQLVIITSPTYEGVVSDVSAICSVAHRRGIPVLVDEAHGAHLGFLDKSVQNSVQCRADIVIQGHHKTLPTLTQTAAAHVNGDLISAEDFAYQLSVFETSSPSYLLMSALDGCIAYLTEKGDSAFLSWQQSLNAFDKMISGLHTLRVLRYGIDKQVSHPAIPFFDRSKLIISVRNTEMSGPALTELLREKYKIELEMTSSEYCVAMTGMGTTEMQLERFADALLKIDHSITSHKNPENQRLMQIQALPKQAMTVFQAMEEKTEKIPFSAAAGRISADYLWIYPPGIPLILPGEIFSPEILEILQDVIKNGISLQNGYGRIEKTIKVLKKT